MISLSLFRIWFIDLFVCCRWYVCFLVEYLGYLCGKLVELVSLGLPLVDAFVVEHLVLGEDIPVVAEEVLGLLVDVSVHDVDEGRCTLQVLQVYVVEDPGVDDDMVLDVVVRHGDAAVLDLALRDSHAVVVHLGLIELVIGKESLGSLP